MRKKRKFKSDGFEAIYSSASALLNAGVISKDTMRSFDESSLAVPEPLESRQVNNLLESKQVGPMSKKLPEHSASR